MNRKIASSSVCVNKAGVGRCVEGNSDQELS